MARRVALAALLALVASCLASCAGEPSIEGVAAPIVGGEVDNGDPNVYFLLIRGAGSCTASLISPHVVLTARHCLVDEATDAMIPPRQLRVSVGRDYFSFVHTYTPLSTHIIPGSSNLIGFGAMDLGLIVLPEPGASETPLTISRQDYRMMDGQSFTAIGFGQIPSGGSGRKYRATGMVTGAYGGYLHVDNVICQGDSGGPMIGPDGNVWGVVSYGVGSSPGTEPTCGSALGAYNALYDHLDWIDSILELAGDVCIPDAEICDGIDNDCNGTADEGCLALGEACTDAARCTSGHCEPTAAGMICTSACDATRPGLGCETGFHCVHSSECTGWCTPGAAGTAGIGTSCTADAECESGSCVDPGDHVRRCLALCYGEAGQCASGEACAAGAGSCGACVPSAIFGSPRGLGEECTTDAQCSSMHCLVRAGIGECASSCDAFRRCPDGAVCEGTDCVLDRSQPPGGVCREQEDCQGGICVRAGDRGWCSPEDCSIAPCGTGFTCMDIAGSHVCTPDLALVGETCASDAGCTSGSCVSGTCTTTCTEANDCGAGLRCVRSADGTTAHCQPLPLPATGGGCSASPARGAGGSSVALLALALVLTARRKRAS